MSFNFRKVFLGFQVFDHRAIVLYKVHIVHCCSKTKGNHSTHLLATWLNKWRPLGTTLGQQRHHLGTTWDNLETIWKLHEHQQSTSWNNLVTTLRNLGTRWTTLEQYQGTTWKIHGQYFSTTLNNMEARCKCKTGYGNQRMLLNVFFKKSKIFKKNMMAGETTTAPPSWQMSFPIW